jgi:hypothetical protein
MGLKDLVIPSETIKVPGGELAVRGLGLDSVVFLMRTHGASLQDVYARARAGELDPEAIAASLFEESAVLAACIIACGCGEPEEFEKAMDLPAPTQIELLEAIGRMTFALEGGAKKFLETLERMMGSLTKDSPSA